VSGNPAPPTYTANTKKKLKLSEGGGAGKGAA